MHASVRFVSICIVLVVAAAIAATAQITMQLFVVPSPSPYLADWKGRMEYVQLTIVNASTNTITAQLEVDLKINDEVVARSRPGQPAPFAILPGTRRLLGNEIVNIEDMDFFGDYQRVAVSTGMLPGGRYSFCLRLRDIATNQVFFAECKPITVEASRRAMLLLPTNEAVLPANVRPVFRWTSPQPVPMRQVEYVFTLVEMMSGQTSPLDAFRSNRPIFQRSYPTITQLPLPMELPALDTGKTYVWSVQALFSDTRQPASQPDGWAEPYTFSVTGTESGGGDTLTDDPGAGEDDPGGDISTNGDSDSADSKVLAPRDSSSCGACTTPIITPGGQLKTNLVIGDTLRVGNFDLVLDRLTNASPSALAGEGHVRLPFMNFKIAVSFTGLSVNDSRQITGGSVRAQQDPDAISYTQMSADAGTTSVSKMGAAAMTTLVYLKNKIASTNTEVGTALSAPMGVMNAQGYTLVITDMLFTKDQALLSAVASIPIAQYNDTLAFGVTGVQFCPGGLARRASLELLRDFELRGMTSSANSFSVTIKAQSAERQGTYISWNCTGFDTLSLDVDVHFPRTWLLPRPDDDQSKRVTASFAAKATDWRNWILRGSLEACTIPNANGFGMQVDDLALDISDYENAPDLVFPRGYVGDKTVTFTGLSAKNIALYLPDGLRTYMQPDASASTVVQDLIIARSGLTANFMATNIFAYPQADIASLSGSLDTVSVSMINSSITQAFFTGEVSLPLTSVSRATALRYKALLNVAQRRFDFSIKPTDEISSDLFAGAKLNIEETSLVTVRLSGREKSFDLNLHGRIGWANDQIAVEGSPKSIDLDLSARFQNLSISYDHMAKSKPTSKNGTFKLKPGTWSFASAQKRLAGFPVSVNGVAFEQVESSDAEVCATQLRFNLTLNLDSNKVGGSGSFRVTGAIERPQDGSSYGFKPRFKDFIVDQVKINAKLAAVDINGSLTFYQNDRKWGNGFAADVLATFRAVGKQLSANVRFGRIEGYRYWYADAMAVLPAGIPFVPGYGFYGAGVAAWQNVDVDMSGTRPATNAPAGESPRSGAPMSPSPNVGLGFKVMAVLGTIPSPERMNGDVSLAGQFTSSGGLGKISLNGSLFMLSSFADRANAPVKGSFDVQYDFVNDIFDLNAGMRIDRAPLTGDGSLKMHVNGKSGLWYVKLGDPVSRINVTLDLFILSLRSRSYFMFGNDISPPLGFLPETTDGLRAAGCYINPALLSGGTSSAMSGSGMATGFEVSFRSNGRIDLGIATIDWFATAGFEANLSMLRVNNAPCSGFTGYNRFYVQGNVAAYGGVAVNLRAKPWTIGGFTIWGPCCGNPWRSCFWRWCPHWIPPFCLLCCNDGCSFTLAELRIGAYLAAGFPGPSWVAGSVAGRFSVLGGLISGSFTADFSQGSQCRP